MDESIVIAGISLIASVTAVTVSAFNARHLSRLDYERQREFRTEERQLEARARLDQCREPLRIATEDLKDRLENIRHRGFTGYLHSPDPYRARIALLSTLYRMGRYWTVVVNLRRGINLLQFTADDATKDVAGLLDNVARAFASDNAELGGSYLMIWREEQRAVGELLHRGNDLDSIGFDQFVARYDEEFAPWLDQLATDLTTGDPSHSPRLAKVQDLLEALVATLSDQHAGRT